MFLFRNGLLSPAYSERGPGNYTSSWRPEVYFCSWDCPPTPITCWSVTCFHQSGVPHTLYFSCYHLHCFAAHTVLAVAVVALLWVGHCPFNLQPSFMVAHVLAFWHYQMFWVSGCVFPAQRQPYLCLHGAVVPLAGNGWTPESEPQQGLVLP